MFGYYLNLALRSSKRNKVLTALMVLAIAMGIGGVFGLTSFWVRQRRRQIGMRRALGATRSDIRRYFQIENLLIVSGGVLLGLVLTYALNFALMLHFGVPRLPIGYFAIGALSLWLIGQIAVLGPAFRAAAAPPVVATRSV